MSMINIEQVRARIEERRQRPNGDAADWRKVLAADGSNSRLLGLIIAHQPSSVSELTALAGRAQPNVSRSLSALVRAGLVELHQNKRASTPVATPLGVEKAASMEISNEGGQAPELNSANPDNPYVSVSISEVAKLSDRVHGRLDVRIPFKDRETAHGQRFDDLTQLAERWSSDWWRMLYRREAYHLCELNVMQGGVPSAMNASVQPRANRIEMLAQKLSEDGERSKPLCFRLLVEDFASALKEGLFNPVARELIRRGETDRPLHGNLAHLDEIYNNAQDLVYWRTAGALGLKLSDDAGDLVQNLIDDMPEEDARLEFASAVLPESAAGATAWVTSEMRANGERNRLTGVDALARECKQIEIGAFIKPHQRGIALAKRVRQLLRLNAVDPIGGLSGLAMLMGAPDYTSGGSTALAGEIRGFRSDETGIPAVVIDGSYGVAPATFLLARGIGDYIAFGGGRAPITDVYTDRQRLGRAFAAELIAPSEAVVAMINEGQPRQRVANHFGAMPKTINHQFENNAA